MHDFYRWEEGGVLTHHCYECHVPLANKRCKLRCLGQHVEWCKRYHTQLFKIGGSSSCKGCKGTEEQRNKRYKEIAELTREARSLGDEDLFSTPKTPVTTRFNPAVLEGSTSKKDRKEANNKAKAADRASVITANDTKRIGQILHPEESADEEFEKALLTDKSIENNLYFHAGTANSREMRNRFTNQEKSGRFELKLSEKQMDRIMSELVPNLAQAKSKRERAIVARLREKVDEDFTHNHGEEQQTMMRKAGFWRWANRSTYNRLAANGRIWDWKSGDSLAPVVEQEVDVDQDGPEAADDGIAAEGEEVGVDEGEPEAAGSDADNQEVTVADHRGGGDRAATGNLLRVISLGPKPTPRNPAASSSASRGTSVSSVSRTTASSATDDSLGDGWTTVGRARPAKPVKPSITLRLSTNGGLSHLSSRTPPTPNPWTAGFSVQSFKNKGDDNVSPRTPCPKRY